MPSRETREALWRDAGLARSARGPRAAARRPAPAGARRRPLRAAARGDARRPRAHGLPRRPTPRSTACTPSRPTARRRSSAGPDARPALAAPLRAPERRDDAYAGSPCQRHALNALTRSSSSKCLELYPGGGYSRTAKERNHARVISRRVKSRCTSSAELSTANSLRTSAPAVRATTTCSPRARRAVERLATDRHYFSNPARTLFRDVRVNFPLQAQDRVWTIVREYVGRLRAPAREPDDARPRRLRQPALVSRDDAPRLAVPAHPRALERLLPVAPAPRRDRGGGRRSRAGSRRLRAP